MKKLLLRGAKAAMPALLRCFGAPLHDSRTGEFLGRVFVFRWRGKLRILGLKQAVVPSFLPRAETKYWYQDLGFSKHEAPDFPSLKKEGGDPGKTGP